MSLHLRMLLPVLLLALVGVGTALVILARADAAYQQAHAFQAAAAAQGRAVADIVDQTAIANRELNRVIEMTTLFDTDASWQVFQDATAAIAEATTLIAGQPHSDALTAMNADLIATMTEFQHQAAVLYGKQGGADIPTAEMINRLETGLTGKSKAMAVQLSEDSNAYSDQISMAFNTELQRLMIVVLALTAVTILGSVVSVRHTSRQVRQVSQDLGRMVGHAATAHRNEIASLRDAAQAFARRATALTDFQDQLRLAVDAAVAGNFARRLQIDSSEADLQRVAGQMNQLLAGVEAALAEASGVLMRIAKGDMSARIAGEYQGVLLDLKRDTNATGEQLYRIVTEIDGATRTINGNMKQILTGAHTLSDRTRQQGARLEDLASSMAGLTKAAREATDGVAKARSASDEATTRATEGDKVAEEATRAIMAIQESSEKINEVTIVVEGLAFQTSILAINAAVEAARAGETGKGFAIVAQEVRSLAERSSEAAKMIAAQTAHSVAQIRIGADKVRATREALGRIKAGIQGLQDAMQSVDGVSRTQLQRFLDLAGTIAQLDTETRMNAQLAQDSVVAASDVDAEANRLQDQMAVFHLGQRAAHRIAAE